MTLSHVEYHPLRRDSYQAKTPAVVLWEGVVSYYVSEGLQHLARAFFEMLDDPKERVRRKVRIQIWAESFRDKRIRKIVERGIRQRAMLTTSLRGAQQAGQLPENLDIDALSRVLLALLQGFILQQAWEPELNTKSYFTTVMHLIKSVFSNAEIKMLGCEPKSVRRETSARPTGLLDQCGLLVWTVQIHLIRWLTGTD
jgi:hypothetical protein